MRQQMVLNAVHDAGEQWAAEAGNAAALRAYTEARAEAQTVSAYRAIGRQAETWVPLLRIVFECLYVGAFPMAVLLMLTPAGGAIFRSYVTGLVWLQSWGPLYAVLHRISMGEAAERMQAAALMPGGDIGISLVAQAGIRAVASDVAVMSGYLSMSVPFLAAALAYGLSKATVLATSVLAVGQDAASSAAHEGTTGNLSLANTGYDTHRFATLEGRQIRTSAHVDTDRYTGYAPAGAGMTVTGDGTVVADAGAATSRIPAAGVRLSESLATSHETARGGGPQPLAALVGGGGPGAQRRRHRRDGADRALLPRCLDGEAYARGRHRERERPGAGAAIAHGEARGGGRDHPGAGGGADRRGDRRRGLGLHRQGEGGRLGHVARPDHRARVLGAREGLCRTAPGDRPLVAGLGSVAALLHRDRGERGGEPRREPVGEPHADAHLPGTRLARALRIGELVGAGRPGALRRARPSSASSASPSSRGSRSGRARTGAPSAPPAPCASPRRRRRRTPSSSGNTPPRSSPSGSRRPPGRTPAASAARRNTRARRASCARRTRGRPPRPMGAGRKGVRDRAYVAGAPIPGEVEAAALGERVETKTDMTMTGTAREARRTVTRDEAISGGAGVSVQTDKPFERHATENLPLVGDWLAGKLFGTARNAAPDAAPGGAAERPRPDERGWGDSSP